MFTVDIGLLKKASRILAEYQNVYWIIGGACAGKSTLCKTIATEKNIPIYDMDEHIFGKYMGRYEPKRHPASKAWFSAENPLDWILSLSWSDFDSLNRAANAEYLDLFAEDIKTYAAQDFLLVDGGISYPSILAQSFPVQNIACLHLPTNESKTLWENSSERKPMKDMILGLPDGPKKWETFLFCDKKIAEISAKESERQNIKIFFRDRETSVRQLATDVLNYFGV